MIRTSLRAGFALAVFLGSLAASCSAVAEPAANEADLRARNAAEVRDFMIADADALAGLWADSFVVTNPLNQFVVKGTKLVSTISSARR